MATINDYMQHSHSESTSSFMSSETATATGTWGSTKGGVPVYTTFPPPPIQVGPPLLAMGYANGNTAPTPTETQGLEMTKTIPPNNINRTLVLCFDGTGDQFDADNSNIVELFSMLKKDDPNKQLVYYQAGIGTYTTPDIATPMASKISKSLDMAVAWNLDHHIMGGYEFLMQNYRTNDKICIFGFSRGAYTARCLAGMIHKVGLLPSCNHQQVPFAYKMYTQADDDGWRMSNAFKRAFSIDVDIEFLGVWDTVDSVGLFPRRLPFTASNSVVKIFRHAMALDERRAKFKPSYWNRPTEDEKTLSETDRQKRLQLKKLRAEQQNAEHEQAHDKDNKTDKTAAEKDKDFQAALKKLELRWAAKRAQETDVEEVWFAGAHCDIGGGSVGDGTSPCLARIPLRWMLRECFKTKTGILFHIDGIKRVGLDPTRLYPDVLGRPDALPLDTYTAETSMIQDIPKSVPKKDDDDDDDEDLLFGVELEETEEEADLKDALAPIYDQLSMKWFWWVLELLPMYVRYQEEKVQEETSQKVWQWSKELQMNLGRGRHVPRQHAAGVKIHRTVKTRMEAAHKNGTKYKPAVKNLDLEAVTWVD
ncbi:hypothetical protein BDN70DRAFT_290759 [Pholiota conissans]|uniref:T6SS Phospholipase effector Tle1-like catalytic domain-containing protein n=1 Tax=Pholiota conissans TaxID=109636 RepID=A0A9P5ZCR3_9AGAR|nr:hypothetical protein BDN70DRAFT_290759 [Pholiota conissans]